MPDPLGGIAYTWPLLAAALGGYLLGSIPFGLILTRLSGLGDVRKIGSGNIGATNVLRTGRKGIALATLLLDAAKGALAALIADRFGPDTAVLAAAGAVIGHVAPVWLRFRGGKGVATAFGAMVALAWVPALAALAAWLAAALVTRYASVASIVGCAAAVPLFWWLGSPQLGELMALIAVIVTVRHVGNMRRLLAGREPKIGARS